ncbi:MAG TPA: GxxExxY protein [Gemmatimonadaceae bacterium]|nr:GxxExxY protein [Gemmatimonadaceae bacterium]
MRPLANEILKYFYRTYNTLGFGYLEQVYAAAMTYELRRAGIEVAREYAVRVMYDGVELGFHRLDMVVAGAVVVEIKATATLHPVARRQLYNYLRATNLEHGLLLYFGPEPRFQRLYVPNRQPPLASGVPARAP